VLLVLIPILAVIFTILIGLVVFLIAMLYMRKKRGIR
jgi:phage shock protein PspC (stress-responsive transcriptional regulator)